HRGRVEGAEGGDGDLLAGAGGVADQADRRAVRAVPAEDGDRLVEPGGTAPAAWVVKAGDQIGGGDRTQPAGDDVPRRVQVRQGQVRVVVPERRAEHGRRGDGGGDAGDRAHVDIRPGQLQGRGRHRVDTRVAGADQGDGVALGGQVDGGTGAFLLRAQAAGEDARTGAQEVADPVDVL